MVGFRRGPAAGGRRCASALESWSTTSQPGVRPCEPIANLRRCYLRQDPVFLRSLLRLAGRKVDRRFYFSRLLPGIQSYVLLRNSFSGKWGSFTQQRPLGLSSVRRMQRPPRCNVTVQCQDALAYLRALPRQAPQQAIQAIYALGQEQLQAQAAGSAPGNRIE